MSQRVGKKMETFRFKEVNSYKEKYKNQKLNYRRVKKKINNMRVDWNNNKRNIRNSKKTTFVY